MTSTVFSLSRPRRIFGFLRSRKTRVALATVLAALLAEYGLDTSEEFLLTLLGVGASLILGIAHEDAGRKSAPFFPRRGPRRHDPSPYPSRE